MVRVKHIRGYCILYIINTAPLDLPCMIPLIHEVQLIIYTTDDFICDPGQFYEARTAGTRAR